MSVVSSYTPRKGRNVELAARHRRRRRSCCSPTSTSSSPRTGDDPARHAHPGRRLPRPGARLPPRAALARLVRRPAAAADRHPAQRAGPGDDPPHRHRARQVDRPTACALRQLMWTAVGDGRRRRRARRAAQPPGAAPLHLPRRRHRLRPAAAAAAARSSARSVYGVADLDPARPVLVPARRDRQDRAGDLLRRLPRARPATRSRSSAARSSASRFPRARDLGPILVVWLASLAVLVFQRDLGIVAALLRPVRRDALRRHRAGVAGSSSASPCSAPAPSSPTWRFGHVQARFDALARPVQPRRSTADGGRYQLVQGLFGHGARRADRHRPRPRAARPHAASRRATTSSRASARSSA